MHGTAEVYFVPLAPTVSPPLEDAKAVTVSTCLYWPLMPFAEDGRPYIPLCESMFDATVLAYMLQQAQRSLSIRDERAEIRETRWRGPP